MGAESLKVEWKENPDTRLAAMAPVGGREARRAATAPLPGVADPDMGGQFNNKNSGKRGLSLNIRDPRGLEIAKSLVRVCDVVAEGFSPGVLERLGLGYDVLRGIRPDIIYIQQSGMGSHGTYGRLRTVGPIAAAFSGTSEMSGLPEPAMPVGWGYSYLDWMGAYSYALAILGALHHRERTGEGQWIDASQCEAGLLLAGPAILDWSANGRVWSRLGNRSPYKPAASHGAYRCAGADRWVAIACFSDEEFAQLARVAGHPEWTGDARFKSFAARLRPSGRARCDCRRLDRNPRGARLHDGAAVRERSRRRLPDGGRSMRPRPATRSSQLVDGSHGNEDRHMAGRGTADEVQRDANSYRRADQPGRRVTAKTTSIFSPSFSAIPGATSSASPSKA